MFERTDMVERDTENYNQLPRLSLQDGKQNRQTSSQLNCDQKTVEGSIVITSRWQMKSQSVTGQM